MRRLRLLIPLILLLLVVRGADVRAGFQSAGPDEPSPQNQAEEVAFLTGPNRGDPLTIALNYIRQNHARLGLSEEDLADVIVTDRYTSEHNGVTHIYLRQRFQGIELFGGNMTINIARDGRIINLGNRFLPDLKEAVENRVPSLSAEQAIEAAARHLGVRPVAPLRPLQIAVQGDPARAALFSRSGISLEPIPARLVYELIEEDTVRLAWNVEIYEVDADHWWSIRVDAEDGELLGLVDYVDHDNWGQPAAGSSSLAGRVQSGMTLQQVGAGAYGVFALPKEHPNDGPRTLESQPAIEIASPFGWHDTDGTSGAEFTVTRGNNVHAYTDVDANNSPDPGSDPDGGAELLFDFPLDLTQPPSSYRPAAVTNLFYWNNIIHDIFYLYGFTEAAGNFQVNTYGRGGVGNDDVRAEAQDGSGLNNANFATPPDGSRPRMQMFIWTSPNASFVTVHPPSPIAGDYGASRALFGPQLSATGPVTAGVALVDDGSGESADGCEPFVGFPAGQIALVDRGSCTFVQKVRNAQDAGAVAVIVANNVAGRPINMGGSDPLVLIPSVMVSQNHGTLLKAHLPLDATLRANTTEVDRDSDLDNGVIAHEYGHGISNRLTGGPATTSCLNNAEQMGEGWSDWLALVLTTHPADTRTTSRGIGTYVLFQPATGNGIRPTPYTTDLAVNPTTYGNINSLAIPHGVGYAWGTMLWEMYWNLVDVHGYNPDLTGDWTTGGNNLAIQLVMDGMKFQACRPGFVDGRNAILMADQVLTEGANQCLIWHAFARRGLGFSADQGSPLSTTDGTEAFDLPPDCQAQLVVSPTSLDQRQIPGVQLSQGLTIGNSSAPYGTDLAWELTEAPASCAAPADLPWLAVVPDEGTTGPGAETAVTVTFDSTGLAIGSHSGALCLSSNDPATPLLELPVTLQVIYNFSGFFAPIQNPPALNSLRAGATVPVMFSLDGDHGLNILAAGYPASQAIDCESRSPIGGLEPASPPGRSGLSYDPESDRYNYRWQSSAAWGNSCRRLIVRLNDGTDHVAEFRFSR